MFLRNILRFFQKYFSSKKFSQICFFLIFKFNEINLFFSVLKSDFGKCMNYLMHYPSSVDVHMVVQRALFIKSPKVNTILFILIHQ